MSLTLEFALDNASEGKWYIVIFIHNRYKDNYVITTSFIERSGFIYFRGIVNGRAITRLINQVGDRQEELIQLLKHLIQYKTPAPPARNTEEAQDFIASFLEKKNLR